MAPRTTSVDRELGELPGRLHALVQEFEKESDKQAIFRRDFHIGFDALSAAVRTLTDFMTTNKPLMDDYREHRAERRGSERIRKWLLAPAGGFGWPPRAPLHHNCATF